MGLCVLGIRVPYSHPCPCVPVQGRSWHLHGLALLRTTAPLRAAPLSLNSAGKGCTIL